MFKCDKCGACCRNIGKSEIYKDLDRGDGCCVYLDEESNLCRIYNRRPLICRVDEVYESYYSKIMTREQYYRENYEACEKLKNAGGN